jgi:hypothetical protein
VSIESKKTGRRFLPAFIKALTLLIFITLLSCISLLKLGVQLDSIHIGDIRLSKISLIWNEKLELQIDTLTINTSSQESEFTKIPQALNAVPRLTRLFSLLTINTIAIGDSIASLYVIEGDGRKSSFTLISPDLKINSDLTLKDQILTAVISDFSSRKFGIQASGNIQMNLPQGNVTGELRANIADSLPIQLSFTADSDTITFQGKEAGIIKTIKPVVELFGLDQDIEPWITEYLTGSRYTLTSFQGQFPWNAPQLLLRNLKAEIQVEECDYTFAEGFTPIKSDYTDIFLAHGLLTIRPHNAHFNDQGTRDSWLTIDFNDLADIVLTCNITTEATVNAELVRLLAYYNIVLPFQQIEGSTAADLTLVIHLNDGRAEAEGTFAIQDSIAEYNGKHFHVADAQITLQESKVTIANLEINYGNSVTANIAGTIDGKLGTGSLNITLEDVHLTVNGTLLTLKENDPKPTIVYTLTPEAGSFQTSSAAFSLGSEDLLIAPFAGPVSQDDFTAVIPPTLITISSGIEAELSGSLSINQPNANLQGKLLTFDTHELVLDSRNLPFTLAYDGDLAFATGEISNWHQNDTPVTLEPVQFIYNGTTITWQTRQLICGSFFTGGLSGNYNILTQNGDIFLRNLQIQNYNFGDIHGLITAPSERITVHFPELKTRVEIQKETLTWAASLDDLAILNTRSELLHTFQLKTGSVTISPEGDSNTYVFYGSLSSPRSLLVKNETPVNDLSLRGTIAGDTLWMTVNEDVNIFYSENHLTAASDSIGYNIPEIITLLQEYEATESADPSKEKRMTFSLDAQNSFLYFAPHNRALADRIHFEYADGKSSTELLHSQGKIVLESVNNQFTLEAMKLNDQFMGALLHNSTFQSGQMSMVAHGTFDHFSALAKIENTLLREHTAFNNIMGFLNTVPALITFSMPEYSSKGVQLHSIIAGAEVINGLATFESLEVNSPLFSLTGAGQVDFSKNMIDMDINLTTKARKNIHKIPLIGYIIAGEEKYPSITLEVTGDLTDPEVKNPIFREVATLPFSMLYRTLKLPLNLVEKIGK